MTSVQQAQQRITEVKAQIEDARQFSADGMEYWSARTLAPVLGYRNWEQVPGLIERASLASENTGSAAANHFRPASKMVAIGNNAVREVLDFHMSRYGCYLFAMNGDPRKVEISCAQSYFAARTHEAEMHAALPAPAAAPTLPAAVGMDFLQQFAGNVLVAIQQQASTTKDEVKAELRLEFTQAIGDRPISGSQPLQIQKRIRILAGLMGGTPAHYAEAWRRLKSRYGVAAYRDLTVAQFDDVIKFLDLQIASYRTGDLFEGGEA